MNKGLQIIGKTLHFRTREVGEVSSSCLTRSFDIDLQDIKVIAISPRLSMDDEVMLVTLIDSTQKFHQFSSAEFTSESMRKFEAAIGLTGVGEIEWPKFSWEEHQDLMTDKVIYPQKIYWTNLFVSLPAYKRVYHQFLKITGISNIVNGELSPGVKNIITAPSN